MGISLYRLDDSVVSTCRLGIPLLCSAVCRMLACVECPVTAPRLGESCVTCGVRECPCGGSLQVEASKVGAKIVDRR